MTDVEEKAWDIIGLLEEREWFEIGWSRMVAEKREIVIQGIIEIIQRLPDAE